MLIMAMDKLNIQEKETPSISDIYHYLVTTPELNHSVTDRYNGMCLTEFVKKYRNLNVSYPYKDDFKQYLIGLQENGCEIICRMIDNICVSAYSIKND